MKKEYRLSIYNTLTKQFEEVSVTEAVYRTYRRTGWNIEDNDKSFGRHETTFTGLVGGEDGGMERFHEIVNFIDPLTGMIQELTADQIRAAIQTLTPKEREAVNLLYYQGLSAAEAAERVHLSPQAINKRKRSALKKIRKFLKNF